MWVRNLAGALGMAGLLVGPAVPTSRADHEYKGVTPGSSHSAPHKLPGPPGSRLVTLPGFQMQPDGSSVVFVQTGVRPDPKLEVGEGRVTLSLPGLSLPTGNVRRPMDTQFFNSPVTRVSLERRRGGVVVHVELRAVVRPQLEVQPSDTGYYFVTLRFPAGAYL